MKNATTPDLYLAQLPKDQRAALQRLRVTLRSLLPEADEQILSRVPAFRYRGKRIVSFGAAKRHLSLYVMEGNALKVHQADLKPYDTSRTVVRFSPDKPLPTSLVRKLVKTRVAEVDADRRR